MRKIISLSLTTLLLASCAMTPAYERPNISTPTSWSSVKNSDDSSSAVIAYNWWSAFKSDELNALMDKALEQNTDIRAGVQRIAQARASLKIAGADLLPSVSGSGNASRSKTNPSSGKISYSTALGVGVSASYELDLFGANRAGVSAAEASYQGSLYDQEALRLSLMGDVASSYFTLVNLRERLQIADNNLKNAREVLRIIQSRVNEGAESDLELSQQKSAVASSEATRAGLIEQIQNAENALAVLLGQTPQSLKITRSKLDGLNIPDISTGQPSDLLKRRPDLRSAEANLLAANADIGAARAAFYPSITLGLSDSLSLAGFGDPSSTILSLASSISAPIFQGGRLDGGLEQATARQLELAETYRGLVLTSFQEVEDAMAAIRSAQAQEKARKTAMIQARKAYKLSKSLYEAGSIDYQTLLDTQDTQLSAEDSYAQARLARLNAAVTLYRVLGGGWA